VTPGYAARMSRQRKLRRHDRVVWNSHGSQAHGTVQREISGRTRAAGRVVAASPEHPQYLVRTYAGAEAVHRPEALHDERR